MGSIDWEEAEKQPFKVEECIFCGGNGEFYRHSIAAMMKRDALKDVERQAKAIEAALESTVLTFNMGDLPEDKMKAFDFGVELLDQALRRYAEDLRNGNVRDCYLED